MKDWMALFYIYGDESGKLAQSDYVSFCGYVGHARECERVMMEWDTCRFSWQVPPLHMRCIMNPDRDKTGEWPKIRNTWGALWEKKREAMLLDFGRHIRDSNLAAVGAVVDAAHFRNMPASTWKTNMKDPVFLALYSTVMDSLDKIDRVSKHQPIGIIIDDDPQYAKDMYDLINALKGAFPNLRERVSAITFGRDEEYPALQMADMIAFEARDAMVRRLKNQDDKPSDLFTMLTKRGIHQPKFWSAPFLDQAAAGQP